MANVWDELWGKVKVISGACASSVQLSDLKDYLEKGEQYTSNAATMAYFVDLDPKSVQKMTTAADTLGKVRKTVSTTQGVCMDARAIVQIHEAIKLLNDPAINRPGSEAAARAYGQLFAGAGRFAAKLPPPANAYAAILEGCGDFFVNMQRKLDPEKRWKKQFEQIEGWN